MTDEPEHSDTEEEAADAGDAASGGETDASDTTVDEQANEQSGAEGDSDKETVDTETAEEADAERAGENNDDEEDTDGAEPDEPEAADEGEKELGDEKPADSEDLVASSPEELFERLADLEESLAAAETESDLDDVEEQLDAIAEAVAALPDTESEEDEDPNAELEDEIESVRGDIESERGPYASDVVGTIEAAAGEVTDTRWTEAGLPDVAAAVKTFLTAAGETLETSVEADDDEPEQLAAALGEAADAVGDAGLDADEDKEAIADLLAAAEELSDGLEAAEEWDDLTVRQKLDAGGFYDVLTPKNRKDFPPELTVIRIAEAEHDPETILTGLGYFDSDFMEENCIDALRRMGPVEAFEEMEARAQKRNKPAIEVLGKIGDERALDTLHEYIESDADPALQAVTLRAIGEIGSNASTQQVANRLVAEETKVRSAAARALGRIGDTRAIDPLAVVLDDDEEDTVRASAAWALYAIGTREALETAADYADDDAYLVAAEAERAAEALEASEAEAAA